MNEWLIDNESVIRLGFFIVVLLLVMAAEFIFPRRLHDMLRPLRWKNNLLLVALNALVLRILLPGLVIASAYYAAKHNIGIFNYFKPGPILSAVLSVLLLDMAIYWQHRIFHRVPIFWRLHRLHHSDIEYDVTTGVRFHPIEIVLSFLLKSLLVVVIGVPVIGVIIFEIILNACAMFNHGNINLPKKIDFYLRKVIVTPDMHRVHHSVKANEMHRNFGFNISIWDRIFGSYKDQPQAEHTDMQIGLKEFRSLQEQSLLNLLKQPFVYNRQNKTAVKN